MKQHSETAWKIASLYSGVLASETRDLAAHIDKAIAGAREEAISECAEIAKKYDDCGGVFIAEKIDAINQQARQQEGK